MAVNPERAPRREETPPAIPGYELAGFLEAPALRFGVGPAAVVAAAAEDVLRAGPVLGVDSEL